ATAVTIARSCLVDTDNDVRKAAVSLLKRAVAKNVISTDDLVLWLSEPLFAAKDAIEGRPGYDYVYDGIWSLVVNPRRGARCPSSGVGPDNAHRGPGPAVGPPDAAAKGGGANRQARPCTHATTRSASASRAPSGWRR